MENKPSLMGFIYGLAQSFIMQEQLRKFEKGHIDLKKMLLELKRGEYHDFKIKIYKFQCLRGKTFKVQKGHKVLRTYKIMDVLGEEPPSGKILFRERVFSKTGIKEYTRVRYQSLDVLEKKLGRKVI
jgi:hypothetical protein